MRLTRRRRPQINPKFLVQTQGTERIDRKVPDFQMMTTSGSPWSSSQLRGTQPTLMVFVKSNCLGCQEFLSAARDPRALGLVDAERLILVAGEGDEKVLEPLVQHSGVEALLVGSGAATALRVPGAPFFSLITASGDEVVSEGVAFGVAQVRDHCRHGLRGADPSVPRLDAGD